MIGVDVPARDLEIAAEFFELFKTPWEVVQPGRSYDVVLSTADRLSRTGAAVTLVFGSVVHPLDLDAGVTVHSVPGPVSLEWHGWTVPIFNGLVSFSGPVAADGMVSEGKPVEYRHRHGAGIIRRVGYDLFAEVRSLLTVGQPVSAAATPTLELHVAALRRMLHESDVTFVEILPQPAGYDFTCCLTHDVDFFGLRRHKADRTLAGFMVRASLGSVLDAVRQRRSWSEAAQNLRAFFSLPLMFLGLARDPWQPFEDYAAVEAGPRSTFFLVPFRGRPGVSPDGTVASARAVPYQASEVAEQARSAAKRGSELAVHGIDAWRDSAAGRQELAELTAITGTPTTGIRMHWLYFDRTSPNQLEAAGFAYDSTWGYNETVGYRAGTSQVFRFPGTSRLLELPLSIMDSALFSGWRMGLAPAQALELCLPLVRNARQFGGTIVINWHERSLAPERLWGRFYRTLLERVTDGGRVWFATAAQTVEWFRWRRSLTFAANGTVVACGRPNVPAAVIRTHRQTAHGLEMEDAVCDGDTPSRFDSPCARATFIQHVN